MDRFQVEEKANKIMVAMLEKKVIDLKDVYALGATFKDDFNGLIEELIEINYSNWHTDNKRTKAIIKIIDEA